MNIKRINMKVSKRICEPAIMPAESTMENLSAGIFFKICIKSVYPKEIKTTLQLCQIVKTWDCESKILLTLKI